MVVNEILEMANCSLQLALRLYPSDGKVGASEFPQLPVREIDTATEITDAAY